MSDHTGIEWTDATWNPVTGCTEVSPGCDHCYAKTFAERWRGTPGHYFENGFDVQLRPDKLDQPLRWRKPRKIFVNSMSDLFHDSVLQMSGSLLAGFHGVFIASDSAHGKDYSQRVAATLVYRAKLYIRDNLSQPLRLKDVADYLHISGRHLSRIFDSELGQSFSSYVRKEKIRQAGIWLATTDLTIKEISERTGFDTVHYFTTVFAAEMNMPPGKFRQRFNQGA